MFLTKINLKSFWLKKIIQVTDSIPWVRCASGNVYMTVPLFLDMSSMIDQLTTKKPTGAQVSIWQSLQGGTVVNPTVVALYVGNGKSRLQKRNVNSN